MTVLRNMVLNGVSSLRGEACVYGEERNDRLVTDLFGVGSEVKIGV